MTNTANSTWNWTVNVRAPRAHTSNGHRLAPPRAEHRTVNNAELGPVSTWNWG